MYAETSAKHFVTDQRTIDAALNLASALLSSDETEEAQKFCRETLRKLKRGCPPNDATSASGATQVGEERHGTLSSRPHRWHDARTRRKMLISTQVAIPRPKIASI